MASPLFEIIGSSLSSPNSISFFVFQTLDSLLGEAEARKVYAIVKKAYYIERNEILLPLRHRHVIGFLQKTNQQQQRSTTGIFVFVFLSIKVLR